MTRQRIFIRSLCLLWSLVLVASCTFAPHPVRFGGDAMGTTWHVVAYTDLDEGKIQSHVETRLEDLVQQMSAWEPNSALSQFNHAPAGTWVDLPPELFLVVQHALDLARLTQGAYDPTIAPLVELWGFGVKRTPRQQPPAREYIAAAKARVGWERVELDSAEQRAWQPGGTHLDVNSLGPGYAVDAIAQVLQSAGINSFLVELGGEMRAAGLKPDGNAWRVAVESPSMSATDGFDTIIELHDKALGTSGDYRADFLFEGRRYSHTLDPRTGEPVDHDLAAVTVIDERAMAADALAAALLVLGPDEGLAFAQKHDLAVVFTLRTRTGYTREHTPAFERYRAR